METSVVQILCGCRTPPFGPILRVQPSSLRTQMLIPASPVHGFLMRGDFLLALGILCAACDGSAPLHANSASDAGLLATWDGGLLGPTPGLVRCRETVCTEGYQCCVREGRGDPPSIGCDRRPSAVCNGSSGRRECDETADCGPGELCCWEMAYSPPPTMVSYCYSPGAGLAATNCPPMHLIGCGSEADCDAVGAPACVAQQCRGDIIQTCGYIPSDSCPPGRE
jgi:hypothetical protein